MDVDKLFKLPKLPQSSLNKRKWKEPDTAALKAARVEDVDESGEHESLSNGQAIVTDLDDNDQSDVTKSEVDPGHFDDDDEEGRFYGGGLSAQQERILQLMDVEGGENENEDVSSSEHEIRSLRKLLTQFERCIKKNQEMRTKHFDEPSRFVDSEVELHAAIKSLASVTTNPSLTYPELVKQSTTESLCGLLSHENVDIAASVIELLEEMTDDDVLDAGADYRNIEEQEAGENGRHAQAAVDEILDSLVQHSLLVLLVQMLPRLTPSMNGNEKHEKAIEDANSESDAAATFHLLGVIENIVSLRPSLADSILNSHLCAWLLKKISAENKYDQNKAYAAELLCALLQSGSSEEVENRASRFVIEEGLDQILEAIAPLRRQPPTDDEESEFYNNLFDALCATLTTAANKIAFEKAEGVELMCLLLKEKSYARSRALKVLNYATSGVQGSTNAALLVQNNGLKGLFSAWSHEHATAADESNAVEIVASLLNNLASGSDGRKSLIIKFERHEHERVDRLIEMHTILLARMHNVERTFREENGTIDEGDEDMKQLLVEEKLQVGLYVLQLVDYVMAWLIMESDGILAHIQLLTKRRGTDDLLEQVINILKAYYDNVGEDVVVAQTEEEGEEPLLMQDVLVQLVNYLLAVS